MPGPRGQPALQRARSKRNCNLAHHIPVTIVRVSVLGENASAALESDGNDCSAASAHQKKKLYHSAHSCHCPPGSACDSLPVSIFRQCAGSLNVSAGAFGSPLSLDCGEWVAQQRDAAQDICQTDCPVGVVEAVCRAEVEGD
jgi:hypothetical protein